MAESTPDTVIYVSNAGSKEISILAMNRDSGELQVIDKVPVPGTDKPSPASMPLAVTPEHAVNVMRGLELAVASSQQRRVLPWPTST